MYDAVKVPVVSPRSRESIEGLARRLLARVAPECLVSPGPAPMVTIFDTDLPQLLGVVAHVGELAPGLEGMTDCVKREVILPPNIYEGMEAGNGRCRFSAAHEIGHVIMHMDELAGRAGAQLVNGGDVQLARRSSIKPYRDPEWQADAFAAALLMPADMVKESIEGIPLFAHVARVAKIFNVSKEAAQYRLRKLGL